MKPRILTASLLIPLAVYLIGWVPDWLFLGALLVTVERGLYEYFNISAQAGFKAFRVTGYVSGAVLCFAQWIELRRPGNLGFAVLVLIVLLTLSLALRWTRDLHDYLGAAASTLCGVFYVAFTLSWLLPLRFAEPTAGRNLTFLLFLVIWAGDTCAFLAGRSLGRTLLFPRVSPKKTVEGSLAGFAGGLLVAWAFAEWFWPGADLKMVMMLAGLIAVAGQLGDLVESAMKRAANLKDSGSILPGHGGLLDRIDSLIFGAPALWVALALHRLWQP